MYILLGPVLVLVCLSLVFIGVDFAQKQEEPVDNQQAVEHFDY